MLETARLIELLQVPIANQQQQMEAQVGAHKEQMSALLHKLSVSESFETAPISSILPSMPVFEPFDSTSELWPGYYDIFLTFWSDMHRKPGETLQELVAHIRQDAVTCETLRSRFICSVDKEGVLKALFKVKDDELDFTRAIEIAIETKDAAKVAKDAVHGA